MDADWDTLRLFQDHVSQTGEAPCQKRQGKKTSSSEQQLAKSMLDILKRMASGQILPFSALFWQILSDPRLASQVWPGGLEEVNGRFFFRCRRASRTFRGPLRSTKFQAELDRSRVGLGLVQHRSIEQVFEELSTPSLERATKSAYVAKSAIASETLSFQALDVLGLAREAPYILRGLSLNYARLKLPLRRDKYGGGPFPGIYTWNNTCGFSSALHCMVHCKCIRDFVLSAPAAGNGLQQPLQTFITEYMHNLFGVLSPLRLLKIFFLPYLDRL